MMKAFDEALAYVCLSNVSHFLRRKKIRLQILSKVLYVVFVKTFKYKRFIISIHFSNSLFHASIKNILLFLKQNYVLFIGEQKSSV